MLFYMGKIAWPRNWAWRRALSEFYYPFVVFGELCDQKDP